MNNPDWRAYQRFMVRQQIESGHDGIFFDNPTVHPQGCYCAHCMKKFGEFLEREGMPLADHALEALRAQADAHPREFRRYRCTIARDFLADMRSFARTVKKDALVTANNSLNSAGALYSQCDSYGYNIFEMSQAEDLVVVEDMGSQPRMLPSGATVEYGPTYKQLHAISHGRPVVAVTIADNDTNHGPTVNAGPDQTVSILGLASLSGTVTDDGLPGSGLTYLWSKISGPGTVTFGNPAQPQTSGLVTEQGS